jgi:hypothetical protein
MAIEISKYTVVSNGRAQFDSIPTITAYIPTPTEFDYKRGFIERYFVQKINDTDSFIYEVDSTTYQTTLTSPFYKSVKLKWKITGNADKARESNKTSIRLVSSDMKSLILYLPNTLQFHKP